MAAEIKVTLKRSAIGREIDKVKGLNITIVTSARTDEEGRALLTGLGMPFRKPSKAAAA